MSADLIERLRKGSVDLCGEGCCYAAEMREAADAIEAAQDFFGIRRKDDASVLSLRDYFAARAMQGLISGVKPFTPYDPEDIVGQAYATADAMIAERDKET